MPHLWRWGNLANVECFSGLSAPPVTCPYRAEQATGLAGGHDYTRRMVWEFQKKHPPICHPERSRTSAERGAKQKREPLGEAGSRNNSRWLFKWNVTFVVVSHSNSSGDPFVTIAPRFLLVLHSEKFRLRASPCAQDDMLFYGFFVNVQKQFLHFLFLSSACNSFQKML